MQQGGTRARAVPCAAKPRKAGAVDINKEVRGALCEPSIFQAAESFTAGAAALLRALADKIEAAAQGALAPALEGATRLRTDRGERFVSSVKPDELAIHALGFREAETLGRLSNRGRMVASGGDAEEAGKIHAMLSWRKEVLPLLRSAFWLLVRARLSPEDNAQSLGLRYSEDRGEYVIAGNVQDDEDGEAPPAGDGGMDEKIRGALKAAGIEGDVIVRQGSPQDFIKALIEGAMKRGKPGGGEPPAN